MTTARDERLLRYLEDELVTSEAKALAGELERSPELRAALDENAALLEALGKPDPETADIDLVVGVRQRLAAPPPRRRWRWFAAAAAAALVIVTLPVALWDSTDDEFTPKSLGVVGAKKWTGVRAYVAGGETAPRPLGDTLRADEGLAFTYTNRSTQPYSHLMVFGVDSRGAVHWYYPAYIDAASNPAAVPIHEASVDAPLPDRIQHDLPSGRYLVHAVFMHEARSVQAIERDVAAAVSLAVGGAFVQRIEVTVP